MLILVFLQAWTISSPCTIRCGGQRVVSTGFFYIKELPSVLPTTLRLGFTDIVGYFCSKSLQNRPSSQLNGISHAASVYHLRKSPTFMGFADTCQTLVRFFVLYRIEQHAPLLVRVPVNSFEF